VTLPTSRAVLGSTGSPQVLAGRVCRACRSLGSPILIMAGDNEPIIPRVVQADNLAAARLLHP